MEPQSSLMAPAHFALGKFISHKPVSAQWDWQKLSLAWHNQFQQCESNVLGKAKCAYAVNKKR